MKQENNLKLHFSTRKCYLISESVLNEFLFIRVSTYPSIDLSSFIYFFHFPSFVLKYLLLPFLSHGEHSIIYFIVYLTTPFQ
jgi:hypothetical protein